MNKESSCQKYTLSTPKKWTCLWALISTKETTHVFTHKTEFTQYFSHHSVSKILSRRSGYYIITIFSKETWMVGSMSETISTPLGMKS